MRDAEVALDESDRLGAWAGSSLQEDMARILVKEYAGDLDAARELAQSAVARSRISGATYWIAGFLAQVGFIEASARNWEAALGGRCFSLRGGRLCCWSFGRMLLWDRGFVVGLSGDAGPDAAAGGLVRVDRRVL